MEITPSPATQALLRLAGFDTEFPYVDRAGLGARVSDVATAVGNAIHAAHGREVYLGAWPVDAAMVAAMRAVLPEFLDHYAGASLAHALVRFGERDAAVIAALHPWDRLGFDWRERGLSGADVDARIQAAGFDALNAEQRATVDGWVADPLTAMGQACNEVPQLLGERIVYGTLRSDDYTPAHDELFTALVGALRPPIDVNAVFQREDDGPRWVSEGESVLMRADGQVGTTTLPVLGPRDGARWIVEYELDGAARSFEAAMAGGTWMDVPAVLAHVDALMRELGRPERVAQFAFSRDSGPEWGFFALHDAATFAALARDLRWPLVDPRDGASWSAAAAA